MTAPNPRPVGYEECGQDGCPCQDGAASRLDPDTPLDALPDDCGDEPACCGCEDCMQRIDIALWEHELAGGELR